jgi:hypothetical protein
VAVQLLQFLQFLHFLHFLYFLQFLQFLQFLRSTEQGPRIPERRIREPSNRHLTVLQ